MRTTATCMVDAKRLMRWGTPHVILFFYSSLSVRFKTSRAPDVRAVSQIRAAASLAFGSNDNRCASLLNVQ